VAYRESQIVSRWFWFVLGVVTGVLVLTARDSAVGDAFHSLLGA
jgi:hypothetical protein